MFDGRETNDIETEFFAGKRDNAVVPITLELRGSQYPDGRTESRISLTCGSLEDLDAATARELAAALLAAVDRLDGR